MTPKITWAGLSTLMGAMEGKTIRFTRIALGNGAAPENYRTLEDLGNPLLSAAFDAVEAQEQYATLTATLNNVGLSAGFQWTEVGIFCADAMGGDDQLYAYGHTALESEGRTAEAYIPAEGEEAFEVRIQYRIYIGELTNITAALSESSTYATQAQLAAHTGNTSNPHCVTAEQVGLGSVPNVATNDQTPTYTAPAAPAALISGERLSAAFGKIAAAVTGLLGHIAARNNPHGVTLAQVGGAAASHSHSTADINAGVLGTARGGTGNTSGAATKLVSARTLTVDLEKAAGGSFDGSANATIGVFGVLPTVRGGTGNSNGRVTVGRKSGTVAGFCSTAEGLDCTASEYCSHAEGRDTTASGNVSHAEGQNATAVGSQSHAEGLNTTASGEHSHAEGCGTTASGGDSHAEGQNTIASGGWSHAGGYNSIASSSAAFVHGSNCTSTGPASTAFGDGSTADSYTMFACGRYNKLAENHYINFVVGDGSSEAARANCFRASGLGVYGVAAYNSGGADYAELFEWADGNPEGEDRAGRFVTLDADQIRIAGPEDGELLGIVSAAPAVCGDVYDDQWTGMYLKDVFGRPILEERDGRMERKLNPEYDPEKTYIPRSQRPEWAAVGLLGKLVCVDDGTCRPDGYAAVGEGGQATRSAKPTHCRVMRRLDENHVQVLLLR